MLGVIDDVRRRTIPGVGQDAGETLLLLGDTRDELDGSEWANVVHGHLGGMPPVVDLEAERKLGEILIAGSRDGMVSAAHDLSEGGLASAIVEMCLTGETGARLVPPADIDPFTFLFSESTARVLVAVPRSEELRFTEMCLARQQPLLRVGAVLPAGPGEVPTLEIQDVGDLTLAELREPPGPARCRRCSAEPDLPGCGVIVTAGRTADSAAGFRSRGRHRGRGNGIRQRRGSARPPADPPAGRG